MPTPVKKIRQFFAWSFSRWKEYTDCPMKAAAKHIDKSYPGDKNAAMDRGNDVHASSEKAAKGLIQISKLPKELKSFKQEFKDIQKFGKRVLTEQEWAFDENWIPVDWFSKQAVCRVKMDCHYIDGDVLYVIDWKTGKEYPEDGKKQLELYGLAGLATYRNVSKVIAKLAYLDLGKETVHEYTRADLVKLKKTWATRTKAMMADRRFPPRPGQHCRWCQLGVSKGGTCKMG